MIECVWILLQSNVVFVQTIPLVQHLIHNVLFHCKALRTFGGCLSGVSLTHWNKQTQRYSTITKIVVMYVWNIFIYLYILLHILLVYTIDVFLPSPISLLCNLRESKEVNTIAWACGCMILAICLLAPPPISVDQITTGGPATDVCWQQEQPLCSGAW